MWLGENKYQNLHTGIEGIVEEEKAREIFLVNAQASVIFDQYPAIEKLVKKLKLKIDV